MTTISGFGALLNRLLKLVFGSPPATTVLEASQAASVWITALTDTAVQMAEDHPDISDRCVQLLREYLDVPEHDAPKAESVEQLCEDIRRSLCVQGDRIVVTINDHPFNGRYKSYYTAEVVTLDGRPRVIAESDESLYHALHLARNQLLAAIVVKPEWKTAEGVGESIKGVTAASAEDAKA